MHNHHIPASVASHAIPIYISPHMKDYFTSKNQKGPDFNINFNNHHFLAKPMKVKPPTVILKPRPL
jgi:hypothetical protein